MTTIGESLAVLTRAFQADQDYADGWHANIACAAMDEGVGSEVANRIAQRFMQRAFSVRTRLPQERR